MTSTLTAGDSVLDAAIKLAHQSKDRTDNEGFLARQLLRLVEALSSAGGTRGDAFYTKADMEAACELVRGANRMAERISLDKMVDRFLAWPLPASVCSDACVVQRGYPHRIGTNLLTADEARKMLEYVLAPSPAPVPEEKITESKGGDVSDLLKVGRTAVTGSAHASEERAPTNAAGQADEAEVASPSIDSMERSRGRAHAVPSEEPMSAVPESVPAAPHSAVEEVKNFKAQFLWEWREFAEGLARRLEYWKEAHGHAKQAIESWCEKLESAEADRDSAEQLLTEMVQAHAESEAALKRARELLRECLERVETKPPGFSKLAERIQKELGERG